MAEGCRSPWPQPATSSRRGLRGRLSSAFAGSVPAAWTWPTWSVPSAPRRSVFPARTQRPVSAPGRPGGQRGRREGEEEGACAKTFFSDRVPLARNSWLWPVPPSGHRLREAAVRPVLPCGGTAATSTDGAVNAPRLPGDGGTQLASPAPTASAERGSARGLMSSVLRKQNLSCVERVTGMGG